MSRCIPCVEKKLRKLVQDKNLRIRELEAARFAYASEFDGDVGSIHENIRKLKAENAKLRKAIAIADINLPCATHQCQLEIKAALAAALLGGGIDEPST